MRMRKYMLRALRPSWMKDNGSVQGWFFHLILSARGHGAVAFWSYPPSKPALCFTILSSTPEPRYIRSCYIRRIGFQGPFNPGIGSAVPQLPLFLAT